MVFKPTLFGLLHWFFSPVKLFETNDDGMGDSDADFGSPDTSTTSDTDSGVSDSDFADAEAQVDANEREEDYGGNQYNHDSVDTQADSDVSTMETLLDNPQFQDQLDNTVTDALQTSDFFNSDLNGNQQFDSVAGNIISGTSYFDDNGNFVATHQTMGVSYDTHYYSTDTGWKEFGFMAETYADISELLGYNYSQSVSKGLEVLGTAINIALITLPMLSSGTMMVRAGNLYSSNKIRALGYTSIFAGFDMFLSEVEALNSLFGSSIGLNLDLAMAKNDSIVDLVQVVTNADNQNTVDSANRKLFSSDVFTGDIFNKMAGGRLYQATFAGGGLYDAINPVNTVFSVGEPFSISNHSRRIHAPYSMFKPQNQAGSSTFTVLNV